MTIKTRELHPGFAAEIPGLNLSEQSDDGVIADIWTAVDAYPVLIFRDQHLTDAQLRDFRRAFWPPGDRPIRGASWPATARDPADRRYLQPR